MKLSRPRFDLKRWLILLWDHLPFVRRRGGPDLAGVREPRRPRPPFRPPQALAAEPEREEFGGSGVGTMIRPARRWWRRRPDARHA
ncbi:MAG TPA: hypothetical protein VIX15_02125 [Streptosporangiaceae bacterium]